MNERFFDDKVINDVCTRETIDLAYELQAYLNGYYNEKAFVIQNNEFLYSAYEPINKNVNVCVVVHLDTVGFITDDLRIMRDIVYPHILYHNGGGYFDDRAGVLAILSMIDNNIFPYIIFTGNEELGCLGSAQLVDDYNELDKLFPHNNIQCLVQLDRHGNKECVFYDLEYPEFEKIFTRFFRKEQGIFSDISILGPYWEIASVNVSVGYGKEHTPQEYLNLDSLYYTSTSLGKIFEEFNGYTREDRWLYRGNRETMDYLLSDTLCSWDYNSLYPSNYFYDYEQNQENQGKVEEKIEAENDIS